LKNILLIRFSSIGDIVLTEALIRVLRKKYPEANLIYLTKAVYKPLLENNPAITKIITINKRAGEAVEELKNYSIDLILDLHKNYRSTFIKLVLGKPSYSVFKCNLKKWRMVNLKTNEFVSPVALRYIETAKKLELEYDGNGVNYYLPAQVDLTFFDLPKQYFVIAIGGKYKTKCMHPTLINAIINELKLPVVILGGNTEKEIALQIKSNTNYIINLTDKTSIHQSAAIIKNSVAVISNDTGLMHIASAFKKPLAVVWGNTTPNLGFAPFYPDNQQTLFKNFEVALSCRPCSKIGYNKCPKKHFNCMNMQSPSAIAAFINSFISKNL